MSAVSLTRASTAATTITSLGEQFQSNECLPRAEALAARLRPRSKLARCAIAELVCTTFMLYCGFNVSASMVLYNGAMNSTSCAIGWGLAVMFGVMMGFNISGSHMNPAVSVFVYSLGQISLTQLAAYVAAQFAGAFLASFLVYLQYYDLIDAFDGGLRQVSGPLATAGIFATYPHKDASVLGGAIDQVLCTTVLCLAIAVIGDPKNSVPRWAQPVFFGSLICFMGIGFGIIGGCAMNPARDLSPRFFSLLVGYGWEVFSYRNYSWFWVPVLCPLLGALLGTWLYIVAIKPNVDDPNEFVSSDYTEDKGLMPSETIDNFPVYMKSVSMPPEYSK